MEWYQSFNLFPMVYECFHLECQFDAFGGWLSLDVFAHAADNHHSQFVGIGSLERGESFPLMQDDYRRGIIQFAVVYLNMDGFVVLGKQI